MGNEMEWEEWISCIDCIAMDYNEEPDTEEPAWRKDWEEGKDPHEAFFDAYPYHNEDN